MKTYTANDMNRAIEVVETAKQNHPVGWGFLDTLGLTPSDLYVAYAFSNAALHVDRLDQERDRRLIYAVGWLNGLGVGTALNA